MTTRRYRPHGQPPQKAKPSQGSRIEVWYLARWWSGIFVRADGKGFLFWPDEHRGAFAFQPNVAWRYPSLQLQMT